MTVQPVTSITTEQKATTNGITLLQQIPTNGKTIEHEPTNGHSHTLTNGKVLKKRKIENVEGSVKSSEPLTKKTKNENKPSQNGTENNGLSPTPQNNNYSDRIAIEDTTKSPTKEININSSITLMDRILKNGFHGNSETNGIESKTDNGENCTKHDGMAQIGAIVGIQNDSVPKIVGAQLVQELVKKLPLVDEIKPWSLKDSAEQERIQHEKKTTTRTKQSSRINLITSKTKT